jgi:1,6-anhydro-N-acetylmuramate kinase
MSLPPQGGLQGGQKDKPYRVFKEVARSQSLHFANLHQAMGLRFFSLSSQQKNAREAPARWEDHVGATVMHCRPQKQLGTTAILAQVTIQHLGRRGFCPQFTDAETASSRRGLARGGERPAAVLMRSLSNRASSDVEHSCNPGAQSVSCGVSRAV